MDGNGRWATGHGLPRHKGHLKGVESAKMIIQEAAKHPDIDYLTLFAYSLENMNRPVKETEFIQKLLVSTLKEEHAKLMKQHVLVRIVGNVDDIDLPVLDIAKPKLTVNLCFRYSGRWHISDIANRLSDQNQPCTIDNIQAHMVQELGPDPDIIIRTGGEMRMSNFLLWNMAYSELFFLPILWPDFSKEDLDKVIHSFSERDRRFGLVRSDDGV
jgi:undecaprenyl diphosphate synthase